MIPFLISLPLLASTSPIHSLAQPKPSYSICQDMEHDIYQGVEFGIISQDQADQLMIRCLINYSSGPNAPHVQS